MLQQDPLDVPAFTVLENFIYGQPASLTRRAAQSELAKISHEFGFQLDPETPAARLTIGQRQQLEIVRLLTLGVRTLILDEPTTGISAQQKTILFDALQALAREQGLTVLLVSHKLEDVIALCDEVVVLRAGRLVGERAMPATKAGSRAHASPPDVLVGASQNMSTWRLYMSGLDGSAASGALRPMALSQAGQALAASSGAKGAAPKPKRRAAKPVAKATA